ncbi:galactose-binding domain-like protein [Hypoxylon sp. NC0597]|nr:galactose-binding domain-like protein [Hypoxylon sp. NC0597]
MILTLSLLSIPIIARGVASASVGRERLSLNTGWRFSLSTTRPDKLVYDRRPDVPSQDDLTILKPWILPDVPFVQGGYNDSTWETINLPDDWAIKGPFYTGGNAPVKGGMGRLPIQGVAWYRRKITVIPEDESKLIYLDIDGAMSYAMVWLIGNLVGGWPYAADEAELFLNNKSQGRIEKGASNYRFRWDKIAYQPGQLSVLTYKNGEPWANSTVRTTGEATQVRLVADRTTITADGSDLSFITASVLDRNGGVVPRANNTISFSISGPGEIVATDNGNPADMTSFPSPKRDAFNGLALVIVRSKTGAPGQVIVSATATDLAAAQVTLTTQ